MEDLHYYARLVLAKDVGIIFLCVCGAILNGVMLYMLISKKQVRASVHTVYMVQIALTDLLVCLVWLVLTCMITNSLLNNTTDPSEYISNETEGSDDNASAITHSQFPEAPSEDTISAEYRLWRIMYSWYNFHYYTNIFLLASMSVERCAAVWKSMRCQRYQYNRTAIYTVSVIVWMVALAFVIPNIVDPDMIVKDSDSVPGLSQAVASTEVPPMSGKDWTKSNAISHVFSERVSGNDIPSNEDGAIALPSREYSEQDKEAELFRSDLDILYECYLLLRRSVQTNRDYVENYGNISLEDCVANIAAIAYEYSEDFNYEDADGTDPKISAVYSSEYPFEAHDTEYTLPEDGKLPGNKEPPMDSDQFPYGFPPDELNYNWTTNKLTSLDRALYQSLLLEALRALIEHHQKHSMHDACDPHLSSVAKIYVLTVNLVIGFFLPFIVIVFSYGSIAYMIGKRAQSRMKPDMSAEASTTNYAVHYLQNPSTANIPAAQLYAQRETSKRGRPESMGRRMSDFMKYVLLRKPQDGADNAEYWSESERECTPYGSMQRVPLTNSSKRCDEEVEAILNDGHADRKSIFSKFRRNKEKLLEDEERYDNAKSCSRLSEEMKPLSPVSNESESKTTSPRVKKHSSGYDVTNENIPQTIAEHPHETEEGDNDILPNEDASRMGLRASDLNYANARAHAAMLQLQRQSRRESGGSYGSSMDSMATDQTSLMTSLGVDKRLSAATTMSALTPPTPIEPGNPNANAFFPLSDDKVVYNRSKSAEAGYPTVEHPLDQRSLRQQKPGSQLNDVAYKLFRKSLQKKPYDEPDFDNILKQLEMNNAELEQACTSKDANSSPPRSNLSPESSPPSRMCRSQSAPEDNAIVLTPGPKTSKSSSKIASELRRSESNDNISNHISHYPKYYRQNSASSTVYFTRGRTYSTTSSRSLGGSSTLRKTMARKNAERQWRVSRTVLIYVIVFAISWLPQRIAYLLYVSEALMGSSKSVCIHLMATTRVISFISVLLNPVVYIVTQREIRSQIRNSLCISKLRHWYTKWIKKPLMREQQDSMLRPPSNGASSEKCEDRMDIELQPRNEVAVAKEEPQQNKPLSSGVRPSYRIANPQRGSVHVRRNSGPHELFSVANVLNGRRRDATIDEMKEEEAAAEESLEKEMERLALIAQEEKRREQDEQNENWFRTPSSDVISGKNSNGSGPKSSSSGGKSDLSSSKGENFEEFWMRWLQSGGADLLSPPTGELSNSDIANGKETDMAELGNLVRDKIAGDPNNEIGETII